MSTLARGKQTLVIYMGLSNAGGIAEQLQLHGRQASTPVAIIERGTQANQQVLIGTLQTLPNLAKAQSPALIVVGEVVALAAKLHWFGEQGATLQLDAAQSA